VRPPLRLRRILLNAATGLSLLLCVAAVALWVRSRLRSDHVTLSWRNHDGDALRSLSVESFEGRLAVSQETWQRGGPAGRNVRTSVGEKSYLDVDAAAMRFDVAGLQWGVYDHRQAARDGWLLVVPFWAVVLPITLLTGLALRARWSAGHRRTGLCPACGYDLRATPERCPECGRGAAAVGDAAA
jgi:hypothetical protein